jgi:hypothetical protein
MDSPPGEPGGITQPTGQNPHPSVVLRKPMDPNASDTRQASDTLAGFRQARTLEGRHSLQYSSTNRGFPSWDCLERRPIEILQAVVPGEIRCQYAESVRRNPYGAAAALGTRGRSTTGQT